MFAKINRARQILEERGPGEVAYLVAKNALYPLRKIHPYYMYLHYKDAEFDRQYGTDTAGRIEVADQDFDSGAEGRGATRYEASGIDVFHAVIRSLALDHRRFTFIDLGSGKGRTLLLASDYPFKKIVGVELSASMSAVAEDNFRVYRNPLQKCTDIVAEVGDVTVHPLPEGPLLVYMYHAFDGEVMQRVIDHLRASLEQSPRELYVAYVGPYHADVVDRAEWLRRLPSPDEAAIWQSTLPG